MAPTLATLRKKLFGPGYTDEQIQTMLAAGAAVHPEPQKG